MRLITAFLIVACTLLGQEVSGQTRTYQRGTLRSAPRWSASQIGVVHALTPYQLLNQDCDNGFYHVVTLVNGNQKRGWLHGYSAGLKTAPCNGVKLNSEEQEGEVMAEDAIRSERSAIPRSENVRIRTTSSSSMIKRVAVFGKPSELCDGSTDDGKDLGELVEGELLGIYEVVERQHLNDILKEQQLSMSGLVLEDDAIAKAGCLAGAQGTVLASYGCLKGKAKLQIKLVDCSTSEMYWSATGIDADEFELLDELRSQLRNQD